MKTIAFINQKGGVGKTTSCVNIGAGLVRQKKKVLLIDIDPQAHLTTSLGLPTEELEYTIYDLIKGEAKVKDVVLDKRGIDIIPSTLDLSAADIEFSSLAGREFLLRDSLKEVKGYDYIFIDCPPSLGILTLNALTYANEVYIPLQTEYLALKGMKKLLDTIELIKNRLNKKLVLTGIICTMYDKRKNLNKEVVEKIKGYFGKKLFKTLIREAVALAEAPSFGKHIFEYKPKSNGAEDYLSLCNEIIKRR